jgi:EAL domain-containing protein (putative c-di-GMP-specific phosphodiesterase class I)
MIDPRTFHGFREHVSEQRFEVFEQPIIHLDDGEISHHEWLVRFEHDAGLEGVLRPAEISGAIKDLDLSMLARAVLTLNQNPSGTGIAINLSGASIEDPDFEPSLMACLSAFTADRKKLILELTETWDLRSLDKAKRILSKLQSLGHPVCLDDVGAGSASIRYLRALPADWLKIDGQFVKNALVDKRERAILTALMSLRDALNVKFIAEGVETEELASFVKDMGFDAIQGYLIGKPSKLADLVA